MQEVTAEDTEEAKALVAESLQLGQAGQLEAALEAVFSAFGKDPQYASVYVNMAAVMLRLGVFD